MGMRIGSSGPASAAQSASIADWQQRQQSVKDMFSALKSGDLGAAQQAYSKISGGTNVANGNSLMGQIGQALQNGDLSGAQKAAQTLQASRGGHHHHHQSADASQAPAATSTTNPSGPGSLINITA